MNIEPQTRSITEQILDELFLQLEQEMDFPPAFLNDLGWLVKSGGIVNAEEIVRVIRCDAGGEQ